MARPPRIQFPGAFYHIIVLGNQRQNIVQALKSITGEEVFKRPPEVKKILWGGHFWTSASYLNTVGRYGNEEVIANYVKSQGRQYQ